MEIKINREIREYTESMFFGLSLRQFAFALLAVCAAVGGYFLLRPHLGTETVSWVCVLAAAPFAAMGFVKYNGMTAERFLWAWLKSAFIMPRVLTFRANNIYCEAMRPMLGTPKSRKALWGEEARRSCRALPLAAKRVSAVRADEEGGNRI